MFTFFPDPARLTQGQRTDVATIEAVKKELNLDKPKWQQYLLYLNDISPLAVHKKSEQAKYNFTSLIPMGEKALVWKVPYLRQSYQTKENVLSILLRALPQTILLAFAAILFATLIGVPLGVIGAVNKNKFIDNAIMFFSVLGISQPSYFAGVLLSIYFGYLWSDWTGLNYTGSLFALSDSGERVLELKNLILPAFALGIRPIALIYQLTRSSMLEVLSMDYIRSAKAKGLSDRTVLYKHALRNALNPVLTAVSGWFASLLAGAYFIEMIFDYKGLGYETVKALDTMDFPVLMGAVLMAAFVFILISIIVDLLYAVLDPRVKTY